MLGRERLAAPARDLARNGFPWADVCTRLSDQAAALVAEMNPDGCAYYPDGVSIAPGALTKLPGLADVLAEWVRLGDRMLDGPVGDAIVDAVQSRGGVLDRPSLEFARAEWSPCATRTIAGRQLWATPAPTHGPSLLDAIDATAADARRRLPQRARRHRPRAATASPIRVGRRWSVPATATATSS